MAETGYATPETLVVSKDRRTLTVRYADGRAYIFPAEFLRVISPSAEVQGHSPDQKVTVTGKRDVAISDIRPVGHYAARLVFDDGHDSGLYTWAYFERLGQEQEHLWQEHLNTLSAKGLTR